MAPIIAPIVNIDAKTEYCKKKNERQYQKEKNENRKK
jgi:hypothetical protein